MHTIKNTNDEVRRLAVNLGHPPIEISERDNQQIKEVAEITAILNGSLPGKDMMNRLRLDQNDICFDSTGPSVVKCGRTRHIVKKVLKWTNEPVAVKRIPQFPALEANAVRQFWSHAAIANYLKDCNYILKL